MNAAFAPARVNRRKVKASPRGMGFAKTRTVGHSAGPGFGGSPPRLVFSSVLFLQEANLKSFIGFALVTLALASPALAQGLVDPSKVAPEFREAAEKRRAEQIRQRDCGKKAEAAKVMPRERTAFLLHCLDEMEAAAANGTPAAAASRRACSRPGKHHHTH